VASFNLPHLLCSLIFAVACLQFFNTIVSAGRERECAEHIVITADRWTCITRAPDRVLKLLSAVSPPGHRGEGIGTPASCLRGSGFDFRTYFEVFCVFPQSLQANTAIVT
jgi:hypothetical protein